VSDGLVTAFRVEADLTNSKRPAEFEQAAHTDNGSLAGRFAQKIDVQAGCDRQGDDTNLAQNGNVQRDISNRHEYRASHRAARAPLCNANFMPDCGAEVSRRFDGTLGLREFPCKEGGNFGCSGHGGGCDSRFDLVNHGWIVSSAG